MDKQVFVTPNITDFSSRNLEARLGDIRWQLGTKAYRWVINDTGADLVVGRSYFAGAASPADEFMGHAYTFGQATKSTAINMLLGVAISAIPTGQYGWLQCYGEYASVGVEGTAAVAIGDQLKGVSGQTYLVKDVAAGTAPTVGPRTVIALAAQGSAGVAATKAFIMAI